MMKRKIQLLGIVLVILPLFFFKYFNFVNYSIYSLFAACGITISIPTISWLLPVGISFYTFMAIGYIVDVYNEEVDVEKNIASVGLFLSFFPYILSGPIERAGNIFPQLKYLKRSEPSELTAGLKQMLWGYFMKLCVADRLGVYVTAVLGNIAQHNGTSLAFASLLYPFQVYADLGGYSLIAIGTARCLGIKIIPNFNRPFFATSMSELWRRWHMSLIQWLTDYIYTPLSFILRSWKIFGIVCALMLTFLISGIWHGASLTFIVWGLVQGIYLSIEALLLNKRSAIEKKFHLQKNCFYVFSCCLVVFFLFAFSQIFGYCSNMGDAITVIHKMLSNHGHLFIDRVSLLYGFIMLFILMLKDFCDEYFPGRIKLFDSQNVFIRCLSCWIIILCIFAFGCVESNQFIYFQF